MKLSELFKNNKLSPTEIIGIKMIELAFGDRDVDLDELEKLQPGIKEKILKGE